MSDLRKTLDLLLFACSLKFSAGARANGLEKAYAFRCIQAEYSMRFSEFFLKQCLTIARKRCDQVWINYFQKHLEEERGHHEWAKQDLEIVNKRVAHTWSVSPHLRDLIHFQLEQLAIGEFISQIGYCICVESYQGSIGYWRGVKQSTSLPLSAFRNTLRHSVLDIAHSAELWDIYRNLTRAEQAIADYSALRTATCQLRIFDEMSLKAEEP